MARIEVIMPQLGESMAEATIVAIKVHRMSVADAMEFYGPVREVLRTKLKDMVAGKAKEGTYGKRPWLGARAQQP